MMYPSTKIGVRYTSFLRSSHFFLDKQMKTLLTRGNHFSSNFEHENLYVFIYIPRKAHVPRMKF